MRLDVADARGIRRPRHPLRLFGKQGRELLFDALAAAGWLGYASQYVVRLRRGGGVVDLGLLLFVTLLAALFLLRYPPRRSGAAWESLLGLVGTFLPVLVVRPAAGGFPWLGAPIQVFALAGMVAATLALGRSFGIAPADRGLRTSGPYRWVRHPLYAAELAFYMGFLVANPAWRNLAGLGLHTAIQIFRIHREELILEGYAAYARRVRFRLIPFIW